MQYQNNPAFRDIVWKRDGRGIKNKKLIYMKLVLLDFMNAVNFYYPLYD